MSVKHWQKNFSWLHGKDCLSQLCGSRKYPYPHHGGNKKSEGERVQRPRKFQREGGWMIDLVSRGPLIQYGFECRSSCSKILSYKLSRTFKWKIVSWILVFDSHYIWNTFSFFNMHLGRQQMRRMCHCMEMAAITCYQSTWSHLVDRKAPENKIAYFVFALVFEVAVDFFCEN